MTPLTLGGYLRRMSTAGKDAFVLDRKPLTWIGLLAFAGTLMFAPWEVTDFTGDAEMRFTRKEFAPLWDAPKPHNNIGTSEIQMSVLFIEWVTIGVFYAGLTRIYVKKPDSRPAAPPAGR